jgi:hypothetical protein
MNAKLASVIGLFLLGGCAPSPLDQEAERQRILFLQERNCSDYGFKKGTDAFASCMQTGVNNRRQAAEAQQAAAAAAFKPTPAYVLPMPAPRRRVSCSSNAVGGTVYTNC